MVRIRQKIVVILSVAILISGCSFGGGYAPVYAPGESRKSAVQYHTVQPGDTLYSIAFRYGLNYREIASANGISAPYTIFVNQRLRLSGKQAVVNKSVSKPKTAATQQVAKTKPVRKSQDSKINWRWPADGKVINNFSPSGSLNMGVDISGRMGESVRAAADGIVVYAGGGLRGYGNLVILKHADNYLSAYGHNRAIRVKEGQNVKGGQIVAEIGSSGTDRQMLHFEIRRDGKPVDPLIYLPDRST